MFENIQKGTYLVGDEEIYFRSKWEYWYALYLNFLKKNHEIKDWIYEPFYLEFPIKHGTTRYLPDFIVTENDGSLHIHEVKGHYVKKDFTKANRTKKYFPQYKHKFIDKDFFKAIKRKGQDKLLGWK
jgi:hypothetical protein